jgi:hypothetical protein
MSRGGTGRTRLAHGTTDVLLRLDAAPGARWQYDAGMAGLGLTRRAAVMTATVAGAAMLAAGRTGGAAHPGSPGLPGRRSAQFARGFRGARCSASGSPAPGAGRQVPGHREGRPGRGADREPLVNEAAPRYVE